MLPDRYEHHVAPMKEKLWPKYETTNVSTDRAEARHRGQEGGRASSPETHLLLLETTKNRRRPARRARPHQEREARQGWSPASAAQGGLCHTRRHQQQRARGRRRQQPVQLGPGRQASRLRPALHFVVLYAHQTNIRYHTALFLCITMSHVLQLLLIWCSLGAAPSLLYSTHTNPATSTTTIVLCSSLHHVLSREHPESTCCCNRSHCL